MGWADLSHAKAMVVGATGSIGSVCSRLLAAAVRDVVLVSIEPDRLTALKQRILEETPGAHVELGTTTKRWVGDCDLIVTATSAFGQRVLDVSQCKPGAVILDVALPPDISAEEAATRPDVLVVESGEVLIPGPVEFSFNIGLPRGSPMPASLRRRCWQWRGASNPSRSGATCNPRKSRKSIGCSASTASGLRLCARSVRC